MLTRWQQLHTLLSLLQDDFTELEKQVKSLDDWHALMLFSSHHLVTPSLYWHLERNPDTWVQVPAEIQEYLQHIFKLNTERNLALRKQALVAIAELNQADIHPVVYKGTGHMLSGLIPHPGYRMQTDIDLLVSPDEQGSALDILQKQGYRFAEEIQDEELNYLRPVSESRLKSLLKDYKDHQHYPPLVNEEGLASIELHRHPYGRRFHKKRPLAGLLERAIAQETEGLQWKKLSVEDELELIVLHNYLNDGSKWSFSWPLRMIQDYLMLTKVKTLISSAMATKNDYGQSDFYACLQTLNKQRPVQSLNLKNRLYMRLLRAAHESELAARAGRIHGLFWRKLIRVRYEPQLLIKKLRN